MTARQYPVEFTRTPSPQQADIFNEMLDTNASIVVQATAGSGKTTTLLMTVQLLIGTGLRPQDVLVVAFNNSIVKEIGERMPQGVTVKTMHAFGFAMIRAHIPGVGKPNGKKYADLIGAWLADNGIRPRTPNYREVSEAAVKLADTARISAQMPDVGFAALEAVLLDTQDEVALGFVDKIVGAAQFALRAGVRAAERGEIDFLDMLWIPYVLDLKPAQRFAVVMVDEAQDLNHLQRWLVKLAKKPSGRMVVVGDANQAIYGFAGATPESMNILRRELDAEEYPLSVSYRLPRSHVQLAQVIVGAEAIQARDGAPEGRTGLLTRTAFESQVRDGDVILARTNRPLITQVFAFIRAGRRAKMRGRDIGQGLIRTLEAAAKKLAGPYSSERMLAALRADMDAKMEKLESRTDLSDDAFAAKSEELRDRFEVLEIIVEQSDAPDLATLSWKVADLFSDEEGSYITLCTVHRSKGLEFENVFILDGHKMPAPWASAPADVLGERCVLFVALTRATHGLYFVESAPAQITPLLSLIEDRQRALN